MKGNQIDDLFREKLGNHKITPPANAWSQIDGNLGKKKKGAYFWLSIAASLLIVLTAGGLYLNQSTESDYKTQPLEATNNSQPETEANDSNLVTQEPSTANPQENTKEEQPSIQFIQPNKAINNKLVANLDEKIEDAEPAVEIQSMNSIEENKLLINIDFIDMPKTLSVSSTRKFPQPKLESIDLSAFSIVQSVEEESNKRGFSFMGGLVSLAKGVSKTKETLSELRATKNEFVTNELKYGVTAEEQQEEDPDFKQEQ